MITVKSFPLVTLANHFAYLDRLRKSGRTNMFGAAPYLIKESPASALTEEEARIVLQAWMKTFGDGTTTPEARAQKARAE